MLRAILGITVGYMTLLAVVFWAVSDENIASGIISSMTLSVVTGFPVLISLGLALAVKRDEMRKAVILFDVFFSLVTIYLFQQTFSGERDAQYQLALLLIPLVGLVSLAIASFIAGAAILFQWKRSKQT